MIFKFKNPKYNFELKWNGIEWGQSKKTEDTDVFFYYIYWVDIAEVPEYRYLGMQRIWYDGPHKCLCLWYFNIVWSTPWTKWKE